MRQRGEYRVIWAAILFIVAAALAFAVVDHPNWGWGWKATLLIAAIVLAICGALILAQGLRAFRREAELEEARIAAKWTESDRELKRLNLQKEIVAGIRLLPPEAYYFFKSDPELMSLLVGTWGPQLSLKTGPGNESVPYDFIDIFIEKNRGLPGGELIPEREWPMKDDQREYAGRLMHWMKDMNFTAKWSGPNRAVWANEHSFYDFCEWIYGKRVNHIIWNAQQPQEDGRELMDDKFIQDYTAQSQKRAQPAPGPEGDDPDGEGPMEAWSSV